jgi:hypothetical protein
MFCDQLLGAPILQMIHGAAREHTLLEYPETVAFSLLYAAVEPTIVGT